MKKAAQITDADRYAYERRAALHKAFAHPTRVHLLDILSHGEAGTSELQEELGISPANLSQHLSILRAVGVVHTRREGKRTLCEFSSPEVKNACSQMRQLLALHITRYSRIA